MTIKLSDLLGSTFSVEPITIGPSLEATASGALSDGSTVIINADGTVSVAGVIAQSIGTPVVFESAYSAEPKATYDANAQKIVIIYRDQGNNFYGTAVVGTVSGTSISFGTPVVFESASVENLAVTYDSNAQKIVVTYRDDSNADYGTAAVSQTEYSNLTPTNFIGISDGAYTDTQTATVQVAGAVDDAQTGLTAGQAYYLQTDGTLSTTPDTPSVFAGTAVSSTKIIVKG